MAGVLTYLGVFTLTLFWVLGWSGASYVAGAFFELPLKTTILVGATLGPLGFILTIAIGVLERRSRRGAATMPSPAVSYTFDERDPFA